MRCGKAAPGGAVDVTLAVLAGGRREAEAARHLGLLGHAVRTWGVAAATGHEAASPLAALEGAQAVLGPVLGAVRGAGALFRPQPHPPLPLETSWLHALEPGTPVLTGRADPELAERLLSAGLVHIPIAEQEAFARLNAIPTAEGAVAEASRLSGRTAWQTSALVVGAGRCGLALVRVLGALVASVACAARDEDALATARMLGARPVPWGDLGRGVGQAEWVFNTVPAPVLGRAALRGAALGTVVVDVASRPGGTDMEAAAEMGLTAVLVGGLPERFAVTAGHILAEAVLGALAERARGGEGRGSL